MDKEKHRPLYHFTPPSGWMNDPNGMFYFDGLYHLFYQHNPDTTIWAPMHWGHAISRDLMTWEHRPVALYPDSLGMIFSGSAVVDHRNTTGLGRPENTPLIAIYTYHDEEKNKAGFLDFQTQGIAFSNDKGKTWEKYAGNPVLSNPGIRDFRDPKVFWHEATAAWIMSLAVDDHIRFYRSSNLLEWEYSGSFGKDFGAHGGVWECPDLFELKVDGSDVSRWVLLVSINPGGPNRGSATQYFIGDFDGNTFTSENSEETILWLDWGRDNYAGVTWSDIPEADGRRIFMGWMSNWDYANQVPTDNWRSAMTLPRLLSLFNTSAGIRLKNYPVIETLSLRKGTLVLGAEEKSWDVGPAYEGRIRFEMPENADKDFGFEIFNQAGQVVRVGWDAGLKNFYIDRTQSGTNDFSEEFSGRSLVPGVHGNEVVFDFWVDVTSIEVFIDGGKIGITDIFFPDSPLTGLRIFGDVEMMGGAVYTIQ